MSSASSTILAAAALLIVLLPLVVSAPVLFIDQTIFSVPLWGWLALIVLLAIVGLAVLLVRRRKGHGSLGAPPFGRAPQAYVNPVPPGPMSEGAWAPGPDPTGVQPGPLSQPQGRNELSFRVVAVARLFSRSATGRSTPEGRRDGQDGARPYRTQRLN